MDDDVRIGHSPDSDDAFMFYGLASGRTFTGDLRFDHVLRDIQTLNEWARDGRLECTAISVHAYPHVRERYAILTHGASMGDGYGPLVVARHTAGPEAIADGIVAVPGLMTSAFLALSLYLGRPFRHIVLPFDQVMDAVKEGRADYALVIHEGQLTHGRLGLAPCVDLGAWWKAVTGLPLPLGVNAIRRDLPEGRQAVISRALRESIAYALNHREEALEYAMSFAREMDRGTADRFVGMYVNDWTLDMGEAGRRSIALFLKRAEAAGLVPPGGPPQFVD